MNNGQLVPQLSIMFSYNSTRSIFYQMNVGYDCHVKPDQINTIENVLPVCDKPYHENKKQYGKGRRLKFSGTMHCFIANCNVRFIYQLNVYQDNYYTHEG